MATEVKHRIVPLPSGGFARIRVRVGALKEFDIHQPRWPKGMSTGGQWKALSTQLQLFPPPPKTAFKASERISPDWEADVVDRRLEAGIIDKFHEQGKQPEDIESELSEITGAPVKVNVPFNALKKIVEDGRLKNQYESNTSKGWFNPDGRSDFERDFFGYQAHEPYAEHPIYGYVWSTWDDGDAGASQYGNVTIILKPHVRDRTTITVGDSLDETSLGDIPTLAPSAIDNPSWLSLPEEWFNEDYFYGADEFFKAQPWAIVDALDNGFVSYVEAQVHGGVTLDDIESIIVIYRPQWSGPVQEEIEDQAMKINDLKMALAAKGFDIPIEHDLQGRDDW